MSLVSASNRPGRLPPGKAALVLIALFAASLLPRLAAIGLYITPDELIWVYRSVLFRQAMAAGQWADTLTAGHPGVTTTWLGSLGLSLQLLLHPSDGATYTWLTQMAWLTPDNMAALTHLASFLTAARLPVIVANSLGVVAAYLLAYRLFGRRVALLAALLLALDPFLAGLSGLLHVDGLATTFVTLSLLALALAISPSTLTPGGRSGSAALAGATAALAVLTKSPALLLLPFTALFLFLALVRHRSAFKPLFVQGLLWAAAFILVVFLLFPALWTSPAQVVQTMSSNASRHIEEALRPTFFLGRVAYNHGPAFYPVTLLFRLSPVVFAGLILAFFLLIRRARRALPSLTSLIFVLWPLFFMLGITVANKKFDRYLLPLIPALVFIAAAAWMRWSALPPRPARLLLPVLVFVQALQLLFVLPYPLSAFNPLVGGAPVAEKVMTVGWGEGISVAAHWLAAQPEAAGKTAVAGIAPSLAPFFPGRTLLIEDPDAYRQADYIILTTSSKQAAGKLAAPTPDARLIQTIRFGGLEQAWIYARPHTPAPTPRAIPLSPPPAFGGRVQLLDTAATAEADRVQFYVRWELLPEAQAGDGRYTVHLALEDGDGHLWSRLETALLNEVYFYPQYWQPGETPRLRYTLPLPPAIPPALYTVTLSLFESATGAQLPLLGADGSFQGVSYSQELLLARSATPPTAQQLNIPVPASSSWLDGALTLLGHSRLPEQVMSGEQTTIDLYWQAERPLPDDVKLTLALDDVYQETLPLSRYEAERWRAGEIVHEKYSLPIAPQLPAGHYQLRLVVLADGSADRAEAGVTMGEVEVVAVDRLFTLPAGIPVETAYRFGDAVYLRGLAPPQREVAPGAAASLTLYWQTEAQPAELYTAFVHLLRPDGTILAQIDRWPGGLPANTWAPGQVIVDAYDVEIPADTEAGNYRVAIGLYTPADGRRLPVTDAAGTRLPDDRLILPFSVIVAPAHE